MDYSNKNESKTITQMLILGISLIVLLFCFFLYQTGTKPEARVLQIIRSHPEVIIESFQAYEEQEEQQQEEAREAFSQMIETDSQSVIGESPATNFAKKTVLIEFSDFQCPYCGEAHETLKQFQTDHPDEVVLVYKNFPLSSIHPEAVSAAKAAWAAGQQGKFWQYHDNLFVEQDKLGEQLYIDIAKKLELDLAKFNLDRSGVAASAAIEKDIEMAETLGIDSTPFFIMNGDFLPGAVPLSTLEEALQEN